LNAFPVYVSPVPAVVVAPLDTSPPNTASDPLDRDGSLNAPENVDDAVENSPFPNPIVVDVELYPVWTVYGNAKLVNPLSLLNQDSCIDDEAILFTLPPVPRYAKPCNRDGRFSVPMLAIVLDAYVNDARVVVVFPKVLSAVNTLDVYVFGIVVDAWMNELIALFCVVVSTVSSPPTFDRPVPSRLLND